MSIFYKIKEKVTSTLGTSQCCILAPEGVNISKAVTGGLVHDPLRGLITELELQMLLRNKSWYRNVIFHEGGKILTSEEIASKGIKYLGQ